ncbi:MAG: hypothetical protein GC168_20685 [Candidatus Hydrogenedens sp.]|nr:hypothetical protein [Candidatus Hydrogenedens sp.]
MVAAGVHYFGLGDTLPAARAGMVGIGADPLTGMPTALLGDATQVPLAGWGMFQSPTDGVFTKTGAGTLNLNAGTIVEVAGRVWRYSSPTAVTLPVLSAGIDYAIYVCVDGSVRADGSFSCPAGYTTTNSRKIGGFHYDLGSEVNAYSLWDLWFRPTAPDPRGMALVAGCFWSDIYLLNTSPATNGTSKAGATIADGTAPPKIPTAFGGDGSTVYGSFSWWQAWESVAGGGKRLPSYGEFCALAYGVTEAVSVGADPVTTQRQAGSTSKWGCEQVTGVMWQWGAESSYYPGANGPGWKNNTSGRGQLYLANDSGLVAAIYGGDWNSGVNAGSRASGWYNPPWVAGSNIGVRGVCGHLDLRGV